MKILAITGAVLVLFSIASGWLIIARNYLPLPGIKQVIRNDANLVKAHLDFMIMGVALLAFYASGIGLPFYIIALACAGALMNPSLFVFLALKPDVDRTLGSPFSIVSTLSFLTTTAGIGGAAFFLIRELMQ